MRGAQESDGHLRSPVSLSAELLRHLADLLVATTSVAISGGESEHNDEDHLHDELVRVMHEMTWGRLTAVKPRRPAQGIFMALQPPSVSGSTTTKAMVMSHTTEEMMKKVMSALKRSVMLV